MQKTLSRKRKMTADKDNQPYDLDDTRATLLHREMLLGKPYLKRLYEEWYSDFKRRASLVSAKGLFLELGSGGGFLKSIFPEAITSDILELPCVDKVCSAERLPFEDNSIACIMLLNVFHHIPRPRLFLKEAERTLVSGGKVVMVEPANSLFGRFVYKNFHHEPFNPKGEMEIAEGQPLSNSNQALPYIFFERERKMFESSCPQLRLVSIKYHTPFSYIISGGFSRRSMLPVFLYPLVRAVEYVLSPFAKVLGLFCTIELEKKA